MGKIECKEHGAMLSYGKHGEITVYRCEQVWGTCKEIWLHDNGNKIEVEPHTYLLSKNGVLIRNNLKGQEQGLE